MPEIMKAAEMKYDEKGIPIWGEMWSNFCGLAIEGGPSHRDIPNAIKFSSKIENRAEYNKIGAEIIRGLKVLKANNVELKEDGKIYVDMHFKNKSKWYAHAINHENVEAKYEGKFLVLPCSDKFYIEKEVKSVLTVWGKANHYWSIHRNWAMKMVLLFWSYDAPTYTKI